MKEVHEKKHRYLRALALALGADPELANGIVEEILNDMHRHAFLPWDKEYDELYDEQIRDRIAALGTKFPKTAGNQFAYWLGTRVLCILQATHPGSSNFRTVCNFVEDRLGMEAAKRFVEALAQS